MDRRVLVVDDDPAMLKLLSKYLSDARYEVLTATSGEEALRILHTEGPAVVLSDWSMPGMDGPELCQAIRASEAVGFVYVIMVTAHSDKERVVQALEAGASDFLAKPFHSQELLARLNAGMRVITLEADLMSKQRELHKANAELAILNDKLEVMATTDDLTGLANRREAMIRLKSFWSNSLRNRQPLSCIMLDVDHFKSCNDTYGHEVGDQVLRKTAELLLRCSRSADLACRVGGEEFLILCPNASGDTARAEAEQIRAAVEAHAIRAGDSSIRVTLSAGVAGQSEDDQGPEDLLRAADRALYQAKRAGRNRVVLAADRCAPVATADTSLPD